MTCDETRKMNMDFIYGRLEYKDMEKYLKHVEGCKDCYEELDINFIVIRGLEQMDNAEITSYNFNGLLVKKIEESKLYLKMIHKRERLLLAMRSATGGLLAMTVIKFFFTIW